VLLGFVTWDPAATKKFTKFDMGEVQINAIAYRRRYLGVRADSVESIGGRLVLRTKPPGTVDAPLLVLDPASADGNTFTFGVDNGQGGVKTLLRVNKKGDVTAAGKLGGAVDLKKGEVYVQSGQITDGLRVPLPDGVTDDAVQSGSVTVHVMLSPRPESSEPPPPSTTAFYLPQVLECFADENRVVHCLIRWLDTTDLTGKSKAFDRAGLCDYFIVATVSSTPETTS
jgi:hypothetical protein